jgi:hypothetical protein
MASTPSLYVYDLPIIPRECAQRRLGSIGGETSIQAAVSSTQHLLCSASGSAAKIP